MPRLPLVLALLLALLAPTLPAAAVGPPPEATPAPKAKTVRPKKRAPKLTQRATVKSRKKMKRSTTAPITARTPATPPVVPGPARTATAAVVAPAPVRLELAYFGAGCFWCLEGLFQIVPGVVKVVNGYAGGTTSSPTYKQVLTGTTGHAEVVQVTYDPSKVTYEQLLNNFWEIHDPTQVDRQGNDVGPQYRSIILTRNEAEQEAAERSKGRVQRSVRQPVATQIIHLDKFWLAEDYHQDYFARHPGAPYCQLVIRPKLEKFQKKVAP